MENQETPNECKQCGHNIEIDLELWLLGDIVAKINKEETESLREFMRTTNYVPPEADQIADCQRRVMDRKAVLDMAYTAENLALSKLELAKGVDSLDLSLCVSNLGRVRLEVQDAKDNLEFDQKELERVRELYLEGLMGRQSLPIHRDPDCWSDCYSNWYEGPVPPMPSFPYIFLDEKGQVIKKDLVWAMDCCGRELLVPREEME